MSAKQEAVKVASENASKIVEEVVESGGFFSVFILIYCFLFDFI